MELASLRAFIETARTGSFSAAALALGLTQPAVSRQIKQLEVELGHVLLAREQRPVALTPAGKSFLPTAMVVVGELSACAARLAADASGGDSITIVASTIPGEFLVPDLLATFKVRFPAVRPYLVVKDSAGVVEDLLTQHAEVGFLGARLVHRRLRLVPFAKDEIVLVVPVGHSLARRECVSLSDLEGEAFVERGPGSGTLESLRRILFRRGLALPSHRIPMVVGTSVAQLAAVEAGAGICFVSRLALANRSNAKVVAVRLEGLVLKRTLYLAHERVRLSPAARALVDFVMDHIRSNVLI